MDQSQKQTDSNQKMQIENLKTEEPEVEPERQRQMIVQGVVDDKRSLDSKIKAAARTLQQLFRALERQPFEITEASSERVLETPEEVIGKIQADILHLEHHAIDDISRFFIFSASAVRAIESWLTANKSDLKALVSEKDRLEISSSDLSAQLAEEEQKFFLIRPFRKKKRKIAVAQLRETADKITQINTSLAERGARGFQIEASLEELFAKQQELALNAMAQLFQSVLETYKQLADKLTSPAVKQELNEDLLAKIVLPKLERLQTEGRITKEDAEEYIGLLQAELAEGSSANWNDPIEKKEAIAAREIRVNDLDRKSGYLLKNVGYIVGGHSDTHDAADIHYDKIVDYLIREAAKEHIEQLRDSHGGSLSPELHEKVVAITKGVICPYFDWRNPSEAIGKVLDLNQLPIDDFEQLKGLERWQVVKAFAESSGVISKEIFARVENVIIQRLFNEKLFSGGRESWAGTEAAQKMGGFGNPEALPLLLRHIEVYGSGHTCDWVSRAIDRVLKESNPADLQRVLEVLPSRKRSLLETLADENSYLNRFCKDDGYVVPCYLQNSARTLVKEQLTKILDNGGEFDNDKLFDFYLSYNIDASEILEPLLRARAEVEKVIIDSQLKNWSQLADKLLAALVNPRNGQIAAFPKRIAREGLGVSDEKLLAVLDKIFEAKTFKASGFERETFLDGLVLLNSKENGKNVLEKLLGAYRGAINDPARIRRVFQLLMLLDDFGEYDFVMPEQIAVDGLSQEIAGWQNQYLLTTDKAERKKIKNRIKTLTGKVQNLTGLKGIEDAMMQKVVEVACRRLDLPHEYREKMENNLEELLKNGIFEIVPSLAGKYESKNEKEVRSLLRTITAHIIEGDFKSWRYTHERSEAQLAGLTKEQKEFWQGTMEPVTIDIELPEDEKGRRAEELKAAQEIIRNAKEHILDSQPDFDFSKQRAQTLAATIIELTNKIKLASSADEKKLLVQEKIVVQAEAALINGVLKIENATPRSFTRERMLTQARELREVITELNIPLAGLDIEQIEKVFTVGDIKTVTASESDDALTLLKVGVEPQETCQSWRRGGFNECLLAYVADSNKKVLNVVDGEGRIVARSIIKLTNQRENNDIESKTQRKTLVVEKPYSLLSNSEVYRAFMRVLLTKAQGLDAAITFSDDFDRAILQIFEDEARAAGYGMTKGGLDVFIPHSMNKYEYSDILGGKISWFDRYQQLKAVTFEKLEK